MSKQLSAACCRRSKVLTICMSSLLPYGIKRQNTVCATYTGIYANTDWRIFRTQKRSHSCVAYTMVKSVLLRWMPSLNDCSKLKGQYTDVKSGSGISVGPSLKTPVTVKTKFSWNCPFKCFAIKQINWLAKLWWLPSPGPRQGSPAWRGRGGCRSHTGTSPHTWSTGTTPCWKCSGQFVTKYFKLWERWCSSRTGTGTLPHTLSTGTTPCWKCEGS